MAISRRNMLLTSVAAIAAVPTIARSEWTELKESMNQSLCRWCYGKLPLDKLIQETSKMGYKSIELISKAEEVKQIQAAGMTVAVYGAASIPNGWNRKEHHAKLTESTKKDIDVASEMKLPNVIIMSGNRTIKGQLISDEEGMENCVIGLKEVVGYAEKKNVTLVMEGLNSKRNHADYMFDKSAWGVALCKKLGSPRMKILYDIYHMQIMEGDVIDTIKAIKDYIGHYHTGGVPGRAEIDETQELNYPMICKAIIATGYKGYLGQEFIPKREPFTSLQQAFKICDI